MNTLDKFHTILRQGETTTDEALQLFDELEAVDLAFVMGQWKGSGFGTQHRMDGLLETMGWYGKEFVSPECVHPLLFSDGNTIFKVDPNPSAVNLGLSIHIPQNAALKPMYSAMSKLLKTEDSKASVRMMDYRGKLSATMSYDNLPINDIFRKVDENTLLGLMDWKRMEQPFFFILNRV
ncbi:MAG: DUF4334 domain-containing protein [Cyanobacteria bacterium J06634_5]